MSEVKIVEPSTTRTTETFKQEDYYGRIPVAEAMQTPQVPATDTMATKTVATKTVATKEEKAAKTKSKPTHYKVVCISLYTQDIENLESMVTELKRRGHTKANKSQLIRQALRQLDIDSLPPPQQ